MPSTITLQNTMNWTQPFLKQQPLNVINQEPGLGNGNIVLGTMLGPPMRWRANRGTISFTVSEAMGTDYPISIPDFGWWEEKWLVDANGKIMEMIGEVSLPPEGGKGRPLKIAPQYDRNNGVIVFRIAPIPNAAYTVFIDYQKKMKPLISPASTFAPVSDEFAFIFNWGFLAVSGMLTNDSRFPIWERYFISRLLASQDGLDEQARAIMLGQWEAVTKTLTRTAGTVNQASSARGSQ
jgi:hypothetical protein